MTLIEDLRRATLTNALNDEQLADFASLGVTHEFAPGDELFREGQPADQLWILLAGEIEDGRFAFDHEEHLDEERDTVELGCNSCHPHTGHSPPPGPARTLCALCHVADMSSAGGTDRCLDCHPQPIGVGADGFDHQPLGKAGEDCALCHGDVLAGGRDVSREQCSRCHEPEGAVDQVEPWLFSLAEDGEGPDGAG